MENPNKEREEWLTHIAYDVGYLGKENTFKIIDAVIKPEDRAEARKYYLEVLEYLKATEPWDKPIEVDLEEEDDE